MNKSVYKLILLLLPIILFVFGCTETKKSDAEIKEEKNARFAKVSIEEGLYPMMINPCLQFDTLDATADCTFKRVPGLEAMQNLLTGEADAIILARDYTKFEDSVMKAYKVKPHVRMPVAYDALVFYVNYQVPIDTLSDTQIKALMSNKNKQMKDYFPRLKEEFEFVTNSHLSSELVNINQLILKNNSLQRKLKMLPNADSAMNYVKNRMNAIGIGYLSQVIKQPDLKMIRIGYSDSVGRYIYPRTVHQANIVRKLYPYIVTDYIYIFDESKDAAMRLGRYISKHGNVQKYLLNWGIAPAFAKIKLIDEG
jgi:ABC-type phosphate transport system substrate-binding protein